MQYYNEFEIVMRHRLKSYAQLGITLHNIEADILETRKLLSTMRDITPIAKYEGMPHGSDGQMYEVERITSDIIDKEKHLEELKAKRDMLAGQMAEIKKAVNTLVETDQELLRMKYLYNLPFSRLGKNEKWTKRRINNIIRQLTLYTFGIESEGTRKSPYIFLKSVPKI